MEYKNILVTGANSLLGVNTVLKLLESGYNVTGFLRDESSFIDFKHEKLKLYKGDITNIDSLNKGFKDIDVVIHNAAITDQNLLNYEGYERVNVDGVKNVFESCKKNKIRRLIYISTANQFGFGNLDNLGDEKTQVKYPYTKSFYAQSKLAAFEFLMSQKIHLDIIIVNPTFMIGAYDTKPSSGKIILKGLKGKIVFCPSGGKNFVNVTDVSIGIIKAIKCGINGESYLLANENLSYIDFFKRLRVISGRKYVILKIPKVLVLLAGVMGEILRLFKIRTNLSINNVMALQINNFFSNQKSKRELGMKYSTIDGGIRNACSWFNIT